ncbi:hypothetical protein [Salana multivorans]
MSRTDAHVPFFVRVSRGDVSFIEAHDHRDGVCDLPAPLSSDAWIYGSGCCHWEWHYDGHGICPCWMCHCGAENRTERRRDRQRARRELRVAVVEWNNGYVTTEVPSS